MVKTEIPQNEWVRFFNDLTKKHRNLVVSVYVKDKKSDVELVKELPLKELGVNPHDEDNTIVQVIGGDSQNVTHFIEKTIKVEYEENETSLPRKILIHSDTGSVTTINFLSM